MRNLKTLIANTSIPLCLAAATVGCMETAGGGYPATSYGYGNGYYSQPSYYSQPTYYSRPSYYYSAPQPVVTQTRYVPVASPTPRRGPYGDYDRDGIPNRYDRDKNGDGVPDRYQRKRY